MTIVQPIDNSRVAYRLPQPVGMIPDLLLPGGASADCDERLWVPQRPNVWFRPIMFSPEQGLYINYLRVRGSGVVSRHRHNGSVHALTYEGTWCYLEHDWVATKGDYAFEPPGETHTLVIPPESDGMVTLFFVAGGYVYVDPDGRALGYEDVFTKMAAARDHYASNGIGAAYVDQITMGRPRGWVPFLFGPAAPIRAHTVTTIAVPQTSTPIHGLCPPEFRRLRQAFEENFRTRGELGASVCIYVDGVKCVDLWGGFKDPARTSAWNEDTIVTMASVVKGMLAFAVHMLADRGLLDYDAPVVNYWPEFGQNGKDQITVRQAISHHAAIHFIDAAKPGDFFRWGEMVSAIAQQRPEWPAGTRGVYHTISIIFILGKLIEAVTGEMPWDYFRREVTDKLGVDYHIRLTPAELARFTPDLETHHFIANAQIPPDVMVRFFGGMGDIQTALSGEEFADAPLLTSAGNARGAARLFAFAAMDGELDGVRVLSPRTIDLMTEVQWYDKCAVWGTPMRTALGFLLNDPDYFYLGPNPEAFGTAGGGGSFAMADRKNRLSVAYSLNSWWPALGMGERTRALVDAVYADL
eukprot:gene18077-18316_t